MALERARARVGEESVDRLVIRVLPELLSRVDGPDCNEGVPGYHKLAMRFFGPDGAVIHGREVSGAIYTAGPPRSGGWGAGIRPDGVASRIVPEGSYVVDVNHRSGDVGRRIGWYGGDGGFTTSEDQATVIELTGDVTIEIHFPAPPASLR